jgi:hypothetical protein
VSERHHLPVRACFGADGCSGAYRFVTFEKEDSVNAVMNVEHEIMGKYVEVKRAEPRDAR